MRVYLAARYSRREELCGYRKELEDIGHTVTSRWLNGAHQISDEGVSIGDQGERLVEGEDASGRAAQLRSGFAREDLQDVLGADVIVSFTEPPRSTGNRGGRHVEFGVALGINLQVGFARMRLIVVGHRENLFHWLEPVEFVTEWEAALRILSSEPEAEGGS